MAPKSRPSWSEVLAKRAEDAANPTLRQNIKRSGSTLLASAPTAPEAAQSIHSTGGYHFRTLHDIYAENPPAAKDNATSSYIESSHRNQMESQCYGLVVGSVGFSESHIP